jgi:methyltransferase OMS1
LEKRERERERERETYPRTMLRSVLATGVAATTASVGLAVGYGVALGGECGGKSFGECGGCREKRAHQTQRSSNASSSSSSPSSSSSSSSSVQTYDGLAKTFDSEVHFHELCTGIDLLRRRLVGRIGGGDVVEVMCGTGRNVEKYSYSEMKTLTLTDASESMVNETREKIRAAAGKTNGTQIKAERDDATKMKHKSNSFDYAVMTFGLCSTDNPEGVVKELARVVKPNGEILLLEHGRPGKGSIHDYWLSNILDKHVDTHEKKWGCAWNKDIEKIVRGSVVDTCDVVTFDRWHFGTTSYIVLRKRTST